MNLELTPKIKEWLDADPQQRDLASGAELLLRITSNRILYNNIMRNPPRNAEVIEYQLRKAYEQRLLNVTHEQVAEMMTSVDQINKARGLDKARSNTRSELQRGKRADHDELPEEIQQLYVDNADIMRRMRDTHAKLRLINESNSSCPDNDRWPLAKALIEYDERYRDNWNKYDHYIKGSDTSTTCTA